MSMEAKDDLMNLMSSQKAFEYIFLLRKIKEKIHGTGRKNVLLTEVY